MTSPQVVIDGHSCFPLVDILLGRLEPNCFIFLGGCHFSFGIHSLSHPIVIFYFFLQNDISLNCHIFQCT